MRKKNERDIAQQSELERHSDVRTDVIFSTVADNRQHYLVLLFSNHPQLFDSPNIISIIVSFHVVENKW
jgi:hypothetical protein